MAIKVAGELYDSVTGQLFEIGRQLRQPNGYPFDPILLRDYLQRAIEGRFGGAAAGSPLVVFTREVWQKVYSTLGLGFDEALFVEPVPGFWDVYNQKGVIPNQVVAVMRALKVYVGTFDIDLDTETAGRNNRDFANASYHVRLRANVEADEEFKGFSANQLADVGHNGITLTERLLLMLAYFIATDAAGSKPDDHDRHLDCDKRTLCSGSRDSDGDVPYVGWNRDDRRVYVDWCSDDSGDSYLRSRSVVL